MGVNGLWEILRPAGEPRSLVHVTVVEGFEANNNKLRALRVGIDASIWFFHAAYGREGENPELRTLFFRCTRLLEMPILPLFVFDGPKRPSIKRGNRISGENHWLVGGMKGLIEAFGFEWRMAPGEAEAELAYLNDIGQIDAVLSDDVDTFLFGAKMVIRNPSSTLSGNRGHVILNADGRDDGKHSYVYKAHQLLSHPNIQLTRGGLILIGLLNGGDYQPEGVRGCGPQIARGLARCGFGDQLLEAAQKYPRDDPRQMSHMQSFLSEWREAVREELRTNASGYIGKKNPTLAKNFPSDFPNLEVLYLYTNPVTSATDASARRTHIPPTWPRDPDLAKIAHVCEIHFEWGLKDIIIKRFRTVLWDGAALRALRRSVLELDARDSAPPSVAAFSRKSGNGTPFVGTPVSRTRSWLSTTDKDLLDLPASGDLALKISQRRNHASTDGLLEYRVEITPAHLVPLCVAGIEGIRKEEDRTFDVLPSDCDDVDDDDLDGAKTKRAPKPPPDPLSMHRVWIPASIVRLAHPNLVEDFEGIAAGRTARKAAKAAGAGKGRRRRKEPAAFPLAASDAENLDLDDISGTEDDALFMPSQTNLAAAPQKSWPKNVAPATMPLFEDSDEENFDLDNVSGSDDGVTPLGARAKPAARSKKTISATRPAARPRPKPAAKPRTVARSTHDDVHPVAGPSRLPSPAIAEPPPTRRVAPPATVKSFYAVKKTGAAASIKGKSVASANLPNPHGATSMPTSSLPPVAPAPKCPPSITSSTESTSILSRLDEALAAFNSKRTFSRTTSAKSFTSTTSTSSSARPFPMAFEVEESDSDVSPPPPPPTQEFVSSMLDHTLSPLFEPVTAPFLARTPSPIFDDPVGSIFDCTPLALFDGGSDRTPSNRRFDRTPSGRTRTLSMSDSDVEIERGAPSKSPRRSQAQTSPERPVGDPKVRRPAPIPVQRAKAQKNAPLRLPAKVRQPRTLDDSVIEVSSGSSSSDDELPKPGVLLSTLFSSGRNNTTRRVAPTDVIDLT